MEQYETVNVLQVCVANAAGRHGQQVVKVFNGVAGWENRKRKGTHCYGANKRGCHLLYIHGFLWRVGSLDLQPIFTHNSRTSYRLPGKDRGLD